MDVVKSIGTGADGDGRQIFAGWRTHPPLTCFAPFFGCRKSIMIEARSDHFRPLWKRISGQQLQRRGIILQQSLYENDEPRMLEVIVDGRHRRKPHQPIQPEMVGSNLSWPALRIARLGFEFILPPFRW